MEGSEDWDRANVRGCRKTNWLIKRLGAGYQSLVYLSIDREIAKPILLRYKASGDLQKVRDELREAVDAVKIAVQKLYGQSAVKFEIEALQVLQEGNYPNITNLRRADSGDRWLTFEPLEGRTIKDFVRNNHLGNLVPPIGLAWHMMYQLCEAFLGLGFARKGSQQFTRRRFAHHDLGHDMENVMLRPSGCYKDYPDVVLIDLGLVRTIMPDGRYTSPESRENNKTVLLEGGVPLIVEDIQHGGGHISQTFEMLPASNDRDLLFDAILKMTNFGAAHQSSGLDTRAHMTRLRDDLIELRDEASRQREDFYEPLGNNILASIRKYGPLNPLVTDEDLELVLNPSEWS